MSIVNELIVSIVGGVATALLLSMMAGGGRGGQSQEVARDARPGNRRSILGDLTHILFAVGAGIAIAMIGGRMLIQAGILEKGVGGRLVLLVVGTALAWIVMLPLRRS